MPDLSHAEFSATLQAISDIGKEGYINYGTETATHNVVDLSQVLKDLTGGDRQQAIDTEIEGYKQNYGFLHLELLANAFGLLFQDYLLFINSKETSLTTRGIQDIKDYFTANSYALKSRAITYDPSATETGAGDHSVYRLTVDKDADSIEATFAPNTVSIRVTADQKEDLERFEETFEFFMPTAPSLLEMSGNGPVDGLSSPDFTAVNQDADFITNHSFQAGQSNGTPSATPVAADFTPWVDSTATYGTSRYAFDTTNTYRQSVEEASGSNVAISLEIKTNLTLQQPITGFTDGLPCFWALRYMRKSSCDGNLTYHVGTNATATVDISTKSNDTWYILVPTMNANIYPENFIEDEILAKIVVDSNTTGTVKVDAVTLDEMTAFNGLWWALVAGQTPALKTNTPKQYVYADTVSSDSIIQRLLFLSLGIFLPHATGVSITIADP